jgi:hypothetical protein
MAFIHITCKEHNTSYHKIMHPVCSVVNAYKYTWVFFLPFSLWIRLSLPMMVLTIHRIPTIGCMKIHIRWQNIIFSTFFFENMCCGVLGSYVNGPHLIKGCLTAAYYRNFLQHDLPLYLEDVPLATLCQMWIQHDEALPHFSGEVTEFLNDDYRGRQLGRGGPVPWPPLSPDLPH